MIFSFVTKHHHRILSAESFTLGVASRLQETKKEVIEKKKREEKKRLVSVVIHH
ncbi:hypothetical protein JYU03_00455 [bacterium AH-315-F03]|nr:hypothetical protein [bacterium AH-315-F03]